MSPERLDLTIDELVHVKDHHLHAAFAIARQECIYFPCPAEIFAFVKREKSKIELHQPGDPVN